MEISFLGQGLNKTDESVGNTLIDSFSDTEFSKFDCLVAFASLSGINGISDIIKNSKQHIKQFRVVIGIDQKGTSKEALEALLGLDVGTNIYYTFSHIIFHPKIYLFEGDKKCRIVIGSSNLTQTGLFQNIEASLIIDYIKPDEEGEKLLKQIYDYFKSFFDGDIKNLHKLTQELIEKLFEGGVIPDENERIKVQEDKTALQNETGKVERLEELKTLFPSIIDIQSLPSDFIKKEKATATIPATTTQIAIAPTTVPPAPKMHKVYRIFSNPISLFFDRNRKYGQLIVKDKGKEVAIHVMNERSILYIWDYFNLKEIPTSEKMSSKKFRDLSNEDQKKISKEVFLRRKSSLDPIKIYINSNYKCLLNTVSNYDPITVDDILGIFNSVINNLGLKANMKISEINKLSWEFSDNYVDFQDIKKIPDSAADLKTFTNGRAVLFIDDKDKIEIKCPDLTVGTGDNIRIIFNKNNIGSYDNEKKYRDKIADDFRNFMIKNKGSNDLDKV
ncbi:MAG: phospholipase D family protein [Candidatus Methanoperedens sp.]